MRKPGLLVAVVSLALLGPGVPAASAAQAAQRAFEAAPCPSALVSEGERRLVCGFLTVPEDRGRPDSPSIKLAVVTIKADSPRPAEDPVIMLAGGPGEGLGALTLALFGKDRPLEPLLAERDWI